MVFRLKEGIILPICYVSLMSEEAFKEQGVKIDGESNESKTEELLPIYDVHGYTFGVYRQSCYANKIKPSRSHGANRFYNRTQNLKPNSGVQELLKAAREANSSEIRRLIGTGTEANISDDKMRTALHIAASKGHDDIVKLLIENGANVNQSDSIGNTPLHLAACTQHIKVITTLLEAGSRLDITAGSSRLHPLRFVTGRIQMLSKDASRKAESLKHELLQIADLLKIYKKRQSRLKLTPTQTSCQPYTSDAESDSSPSVDDLAEQLEGLCNLTEILDVSGRLYNLSQNELG